MAELQHLGNKSPIREDEVASETPPGGQENLVTRELSRREKVKVERKVRAVSQEEIVEPIAEWASFLADLSSGDRKPEWRMHDRTHLEMAVDFKPNATDKVPTRSKAEETTYVWDVFFFIPSSLRIDRETYLDEQLYRDFQSYVRFAVENVPLSDLAHSCARRLGDILENQSEEEGVRELRIYASQVRTALLAARRNIDSMDQRSDVRPLAAACQALLARTIELLQSLRRELPKARHDATRLAALWVDEDLSLVSETLFASLSLSLRSDGCDELASRIAAGAVAEARYRRSKGLDGIGHAKVTKRDIEHLEFRRHVLKRFNASVLSVDRDVQPAGRWTLEFLYAVAASVAMAFALAAAIYTGTQNANFQSNMQSFGGLWTWASLVVLAYAGKDRIKASLQGYFSSWVRERYPDRRWRLLHPQSRRRVIATVAERSEFLPKSKVPREVLAVRNSTRQHSLEDHARPENVLHHQKSYELDGEEFADIDARFSALTEVFRLDLRRWLVHTDDPKQRIAFADPDDAHVYSASAPRVYNIAVVYRLQREGAPSAPWERIRVVVSRKGILRVESVTEGSALKGGALRGD